MEILCRFTQMILIHFASFKSKHSQLFNSIITIVSIFVAMITLNVPLTIITLVMVAIMLVVAKNAVALSSKYFNQQQNNLGKLNGFIEEMISGQKVVKVFCYEKEV